MLHIVCIRAGELFSPAYVDILFDSVRRNLADGFEGDFTCFTDQQDQLDDGIIVRPLPANLPGWWSKLALFRGDLFPKGDRVLFLDLDTVITGRLDEIASYMGDFAILRDFYRPTGLQSSVMAWEAGTHQNIWDTYVAASYPDVPGGDQAWIERQLYACDLWQELFPSLFVSYKQIKSIPSKASVVVFHGKPRPHEVTDGWVPEVWKIGGMTRADLDKVCNTENGVLIDNVRSACGRDLPWLDTADAHDGHVVLVGGGPSLKTRAGEISWRQGQGQSVWALNGSAKWLQENGITPNYHVLVDARAGNVAFVADAAMGTIHLIASQCDRAVFERLEENRVVLWHPNLEAFLPVLEKETEKPVHMIGGGSTVGLNAMVLAFALGYRKMHLYGFDSSYADGDHHAYEQAMNNGQLIVDAICAGKKFKTSPWMAQQAQEFVTLARGLMDDGCVITVAGDGLLPTLARDMMTAPCFTAADIRAREVLKRLGDIPNPRGAEIGVFAGDMSASLLRSHDSLLLDMVDSWEGLGASYQGDSGDFHATLTDDAQSRFKATAVDRTAFAGPRRSVIQARSVDYAPRTPNMYDFVFLDADHSYQGCKDDIEAWAPRVKPGGLLCGHDYENTDFPGFGVTEAVNEYCERHNLTLDLGDNYTWFVRLPLQPSQTRKTNP